MIWKFDFQRDGFILRGAGAHAPRRFGKSFRKYIGMYIFASIILANLTHTKIKIILLNFMSKNLFY